MLLVDAIKTMLKHGVSGLPVVDQAGKLVGILTHRATRFELSGCLYGHAA
jgi:IMP dehydrogenase